MSPQVSENQIYINSISQTFLDFPDNESLAMILFTEKCLANCKNCQNKDLQIGNDNHLRTVSEALKLIRDYSKRCESKKLVFSGGDPLCNRPAIFEIINELVKENFDICVYTGYSINQVISFFKEYEKERNIKLFRPLYLKCGTYDETQRDPNSGKDEHKFILASKNQAFYKWDGLRNIYYPISKGNVLEFNDE